MRSIFTHTINPANEAIRVDALDGPGPGGASHEYRVALPDGDEVLLQFQNGPVLANGEGVNGLTPEALLAIVLDHMHAFQKGPYAISQYRYGERGICTWCIKPVRWWHSQVHFDSWRREHTNCFQARMKLVMELPTTTRHITLKRSKLKEPRNVTHDTRT